VDAVNMVTFNTKMQCLFTHCFYSTTVNIVIEITQILSYTQEEESSNARSGEFKRSGTGFC
jgi:hypothetical protein